MQVRAGGVAHELVTPAIEFETSGANPPGMASDKRAEMAVVGDPAFLVSVREHDIAATDLATSAVTIAAAAITLAVATTLATARDPPTSALLLAIAARATPASTRSTTRMRRFQVQ